MLGELFVDFASSWWGFAGWKGFRDKLHSDWMFIINYHSLKKASKLIQYYTFTYELADDESRESLIL